MSKTVTVTDKAKGVLLALSKAGSATASALGTTSSYIAGLVANEYVAKDGTIKTPGRGRPANAYKLTTKGKRLATKLAAA